MWIQERHLISSCWLCPHWGRRPAYLAGAAEGAVEISGSVSAWIVWTIIHKGSVGFINNNQIYGVAIDMFVNKVFKKYFAQTEE